METATLATPGTYVIDKAHTEVGFVARHLIGTKVRGRFTQFDGTIVVADPVEQSTVEAVVEAASIDTGVEMRDDHLRNNDFLDVPNHPQLTLKSTGLDPGVGQRMEAGRRPHHPWRDPTGRLRPGVPGRRPRHAAGLPAHRPFGQCRDRPAGLRGVVQRRARGRQHRGRQQGEDRARDRGGAPALTGPRRSSAPHRTPPSTGVTLGRWRPTARRSRPERPELGRRRSSYVLAVDLGTGGPKVAVVSATGRIVGQRVGAGGAAPSARRRGRAGPRGVVGGHRAAPPAGRWPSSRAVTPSSVIGVGCTAQWSGTVAVDDDGDADCGRR